MVVYDAGTKELLFQQSSLINEMGDELECVNFNPDGTIMSKSNKSYTYDERGNWTLEEILDKNNVPYESQERFITYYS